MTEQPLPPSHDISPVAIEEEMRRSYLDYAMSVIVSRALPDVRDGLKPVHRRILYTMKENGYDHSKPFKKSARIVGDVMGKYHPHGDSAIYDAMVRMAQDFSMRLPLIEGQGNFGSMDGDPPAAMRYTEARLALSAESLLADIERETVDFQENYDGSTHEPTVLPSQIPNLLVNGAGGIAVGMATNIPTHNLVEIVDACCAYIDRPEITVEELADMVAGPDFPTGGIIMGKSGIRSALLTGRGSIILRSRTTIENIAKDKQAIVVSEVPFQVNKSRMVERIAEVAHEKLVDGITDLRDESDRDGVRVVIELRRDTMPEVVLNQLFRHTPLQISFGINMLALNGGRPETMNLRDIIVAFIAFREQVITRRTIYDLKRARERAHVLLGLGVAVANLDPVIQIIRKAKDPVEARAKLMAEAWPSKELADYIRRIDAPESALPDGTYRLTEVQARAILDLRLHRLTGLERDKIIDDLKQLVLQIDELLAVLASRERLYAVMRAELVALKEKFGDARRTTIEEHDLDTDIEDLIQREDMVVTVTHGGYIKRVPLSTYRAQRRGGKGRAAMSTRDEDFVTRIFVASTHTPVLFFSSRGIVYLMKVYKLPLGTPQARGKALINLLPLQEGETITTVMPLPEDETRWKDMFVMFATQSGNIRRNTLEDFTQVKANGKIAMKLDDGDALVSVQVCDATDDVLLAAAGGKCIRFSATDVRVFASRASDGVRGIQLAKGDKVISMSILKHAAAESAERYAYLKYASAKRRAESGEAELEVEAAAADMEEAEETAAAPVTLSEERLARLASTEEFILTVATDGYGKRSSAYEYRVTKRGGKGIESMSLGKGGDSSVVAAFPVLPTDQIMLVTNGGQIIRCPVNDIRIAGRTTRGVTLFRVAEGEKVVSVARLDDTGGDVKGQGSNGANGAAESDTVEGGHDGGNGSAEEAPEADAQ
ncbi:MAG: DNA gyrase subunit A [Alphaproteobacteria bacterium]